MKRAFSRYAVIGFAVVAGILGGITQPVLAGWSGTMNGAGFGKAQVNVTSSAKKTNIVSTTNMNTPSAAMTNTPGYAFGGPLPPGSSALTLARIIGRPGYVWQATTIANAGDKTDNNSLSNLVKAVSASSSGSVEVTGVEVYPDGGCNPGDALYVFHWHWTGTDAGTAQHIQWWNYDGALPPNFNGDFGSLPGASFLDDIYGVPRSPCDDYDTYRLFEVYCDPCSCDTNLDEDVTWYICGPGDSNKLYMVTDGIAVSTGCTLFFEGFQPPIGAADVTGGSCSRPVRTFKYCSTIPIKMKLTCGGVPVTTGVHTLTYTRCSTQCGTSSIIDATPKDAATTGNQFVLADATTGLWKFNLDTRKRGLSRGRWKLTATLSDGSQHFVYIEIR